MCQRNHTKNHEIFQHTCVHLCIVQTVLIQLSPAMHIYSKRSLFILQICGFILTHRARDNRGAHYKGNFCCVTDVLLSEEIPFLKKTREFLSVYL